MIVRFSINSEIGALESSISGTVPAGVSQETTIEITTSLSAPRRVCARSKLPTRQKLMSVSTGNEPAGIVAVTELPAPGSPAGIEKP